MIGAPDRVFVRAPRLLFVEFKTERGRVSPDQQRWLDELTAEIAEHRMKEALSEKQRARLEEREAA